MITIKKIPIIKVGQMVYFKDGPNKTPYRWKIWDDVESIPEYMEFCNKKEAKYRYVIEFKWKISF